MRSHFLKPRPAGLAAGLAVGLLGPMALAAQEPDSLDRAVENARQAWLRHDARTLVIRSDTVRLQLPEVGRTAAMEPDHAARVLGEYLASATEVDLALRQLRVSAEDHVYAQFSRRYVVQGTTDERAETIFLGFRRVEGEWRLREIRVLP